MNPTLKRLEEIEAVCHEDAHLVGWLCARLRDALAVIAQAPLAEATAAYRRLFGHAEVGEMLPAKLPLGHEFVAAVDSLGRASKSSADFCGECGQPRSAHEPPTKPTL